MTFRVGMKVACVDAAPMRGFISEGEVFTIVSVEDTPAWTALFFAERESIPGYRGFYAKYFRPLVSCQTDISALQALLVPGAKIREEA